MVLDRRLRRYVRHGTLTQLAAFEAVVRLSGFTNAARSLHMSQPTVSQLVKKLALTLDVVLFETTAPDIRLTDAGRATYEFAQDLFQQLTGFEGRLNRMRHPEQQTLQIALCTAGEFIAPTLVQSFCKTHPEVRIALSVGNRTQLVERLRQGTDDFYIFDSATEALAARTHALQNDVLDFYASVRHPLAKRKRVTFADLSREPLVLREVGSATREVVEALYAQHAMKPNVRMEMDDNDAIKRAVATGFGISLLSRYAVERNPRHDALVPLRLENFSERRQWQLAYDASRRLTPLDEAFIAEVLLRAQELEQLYLNPACAGGKRAVRDALLRRSIACS